MKKINILLMALFISLAVVFSVNIQNVNAQASIACEGLVGITDNADCGENTGDSGGIDNAIKTGLNLLSIAAGIVAVVMVMIAGLKFINSQGDAGRVASARSTIIYAIIGLGIVALSQTIVFFVVGNKTEVPPATTGGYTIQLDSLR